MELGGDINITSQGALQTSKSQLSYLFPIIVLFFLKKGAREAQETSGPGYSQRLRG